MLQAFSNAEHGLKSAACTLIPSPLKANHVTAAAAASVISFWMIKTVPIKTKIEIIKEKYMQKHRLIMCNGFH